MRNIDEIVSRMTLEEKAGMLSGADFWRLKGVERLGIPMMTVTDGPHGLRKQDDRPDHLALNESVPAVCFPSACATACSFDRRLMEDIGAMLGDECQAENVGVILGPGANIKRGPLCGRNFEYFSEDPYLSGEMAAAHIRGVQSRGVGASLKHYALNNQETRRMSLNVRADERARREIYLSSFETAVKKGKPWTVMCSYNKIDGVYMSENPLYLEKILRGEWGFDGFTVTDWGACCSHIAGVMAGMDLQMPYAGPLNDQELADAARRGVVPIEKIDEAVKRILDIVFRYADNHKPDASYDKDDHDRRSGRAAAESAVLLKNDGGILPLSAQNKVAFIGQYAVEPRYQGSGSSRINATRITSAMDAAKGIASVSYARGFDDSTAENAAELIAEAAALAADSDTAVLFVGLPGSFESEGFDRAHMRLPDNQIALIRAVARANPRVVVVLHNGSPIEVPWINDVQAMLEMYLGGQAVGAAAVDLLYGRVNPSGKLAETFPVKLSDNPSYLNFPGDGDDAFYRESIYVGYRYYDKKEMDVRFPFGHGLSYTSFKYSNLKASASVMNVGDSVSVSVDITNTGSRAGKEIVQLYVRSKHNGISRPERELRGFEKISLEPGETKTVSFTLTSRDYAYYEAQLDGWYAENGLYAIDIGASSRDIRASADITIEGAKPLIRPLTTDSTLRDLMAVPGSEPIMKPLMDGMRRSFGVDADNAAMGEGADQMFLNMIGDMPVHTLRSFASGGEPLDVEGLVAAVASLIN
ncbi:MAG: glycoside hydrolase family 3 C-terminal domain-containing protein [Oscillospiraceae bacterium]|jgi:beta-glucosidase|nr:glycoside hydrolase family 3 C-terminal domain-containing protein [Oscillospiraceae bacterium]